MKILFVGDYSNLHTTLARELRKMGHQADVLSDGCGHMNLEPDYYLKRQPGFFNSFKYLFDIFNILPHLKDYDVVQLINTNFLSLKPQKLKYIFDILKKQNKSLFLTLAGNDYYFCKACYEGKLFRYSEFKIRDQFTTAHYNNPNLLYGWISTANRHWAEYLFKNINGAMAVLPEYFMPVKNLLNERVGFTNLPVDLSQLPDPTRFKEGKINIMVAVRSGVEDMKGTKVLSKIALEIEKERKGNVVVDIVKDVSFNEFLTRLAKADIVLDQLYSYSPAMTALYAMALEKVVGTGAQPEYYQAIGNPKEHPLLSLSPFDNDIKERLLKLIDEPENIERIGKEARKIVLNNNESKMVTQKFINHWKNHSG